MARAFTSISRKLLLALTFLLFLGIQQARATGFQALDEVPTGNSPAGDEFSTTPYTQYGEFNEEEEEKQAALYFQYGRFFGVSIGFGFEGVTGNRGLVWEGGFPLIDFRLHYWFDFHFAMALAFSSAQHQFEAPLGSGNVNNVTTNRLGIDFKYYFATQNISAPVTFSNPYLLFGVASFQKEEEDLTNEAVNSDGAFGFTAGFGFEFLISHRKAYLNIEGKFHQVNYDDRFDRTFEPDVPDLSGFFYSVTTSVLFIW